MAKMRKTAEERKKEIMKVAGELFAKKGYEETSVNDILKQIGIAKGTFYHHFKSKEDVLNTFLDLYFKQFAQYMKQLIQDEKLNAIEKFKIIMSKSYNFTKGKKRISADLLQEKNAIMLVKIQKKKIIIFAPLLLEIVEQGINEGLFDIEYPEEIVTFLMSQLYIGDPQRLLEDGEKEYYRIMSTIMKIWEKVLGVSKGTLSIEINDN